MGFKLGSSDVSKVYVGSTEATKVYLGSTQIYPSGAYDPDAQAFITAVATLTTPQEVAVNNLVLAMKSAGVWSKGYAFYPMIGGTATTHKWNLFNPLDTDAAFRGVFGGGWTHNANGATPNGANAYMDSKLVPSSVLTDNDTAFVFSTTTAGARNSAELGCGASSTNPRINMHVSYGGVAYSDLYTFTTARISIANTLAGCFISSRTSSNVHKLFRNGSQIGTTNTGTPDSMATITTAFHLSCYAYGALKALYSNRLINSAGVFQGLSDTEASDLTTAIQNFNTALSR